MPGMKSRYHYKFYKHEKDKRIFMNNFMSKM